MNLESIPKIAVIFGTRPEAIKLAPLVLALQRNSSCVCRLWLTGQHRAMLDQVMQLFGLEADHDLEVMEPNQSLSSLTAKLMVGLSELIAKEGPSMIVVQGDTTTALCGALAGFYAKVPVAHVEAGLRTYNLLAPWPEEANRRMVTTLAALHFAPTEVGRANLLQEKVAPDRIVVTGNTVVDALFLVLEKLKSWEPQLPGVDLETVRVLESSPIVLITGHRRESFGAGLEAVCHAVVELAKRHSEVQFVYPVHLNPIVTQTVRRVLLGAGLPNIHLLEPLGYLPFVWAMARAKLILTDSGGIQEEAPSLGKPVLVTRSTTERPEALTTGLVRLVGTDQNRIVAEATRVLQQNTDGPRSVANPYGDGKASERIIAACLNFLDPPV